MPTLTAQWLVPDDSLNRLNDFLADEDEFDEEFLKPTDYAVSEARALVSGAHALLDLDRTLRPAFSTMGDGSLYIAWKQPQGEVRVLVPPSAEIPTRLYWRIGEEDGVISQITPEAAAERIRLLAEGGAGA